MSTVRGRIGSWMIDKLGLPTAADYTEKLISTVPWDDAGAYVRFSVTFIAKDQTDEQRALEEIGRRLQTSKFEF